ncbi:hypothetical protein Tco_1346745 [Tanacetum coccineum]
MHTCASNSELVEPLSEPQRTLNRILRRQNRRVPYDQRNNPPQHPRIVYPPVLNINYFCHFLDILRNYVPMGRLAMWLPDHVVAQTLSQSLFPEKTVTNLLSKLFSTDSSEKSMAFSQHENESLTDAWLRMKEMLRNCMVHYLF